MLISEMKKLHPKIISWLIKMATREENKKYSDMVMIENY